MVRFPPRWVRTGVAIAAILVFTRMGSVYADDDTALGQAQRDVDVSDYMSARTSLTAALNGGNAGPGELAQIYKLAGIVEAALGNASGSTTAFSKWLALDPKAALAPGTSPKITRPFQAAADLARKHEPLKVKTETTADPPSVTVIIASDPAGLIARARVEVRADGKPEQTLEGGGKARIKIDLPHGKRLDLRVQALDEHGNRVVELGTSDVPIVITGAEVVGTKPPPEQATVGLLKTHKDTPETHPRPLPTAPAHDRPLWAKWWLWGSVAVAVGAGGAYFGWEARSATNELNALNASSSDHRFSEAQEVESRARRDVLVFNIGMGTAGTLALGATILYLTKPRVTVETRLSAVPIRGGGVFVLGGHF